ncbi:MAG: single-stranded DNA-binding protein [Sciscionella sp.]
MYETHATVVGTVLNDPRQRRTMEGLKVVNFRLAANERKFDRETGEW